MGAVWHTLWLVPHHVPALGVVQDRPDGKHYSGDERTDSLGPRPAAGRCQNCLDAAEQEGGLRLSQVADPALLAGLPTTDKDPGKFLWEAVGPRARPT